MNIILKNPNECVSMCVNRKDLFSGKMFVAVNFKRRNNEGFNENGV